MKQTHQSHEAAQHWLLEFVELSIKSISLATSCLLPRVACVLMQRVSVIMQLVTRWK